jgi:hypothetical protein
MFRGEVYVSLRRSPGLTSERPAISSSRAFLAASVSSTLSTVRDNEFGLLDRCLVRGINNGDAWQGVFDNRLEHTSTESYKEGSRARIEWEAI